MQIMPRRISDTSSIIDKTPRAPRRQVHASAAGRDTPIVVIIAGMHRSGTSLVSRVCNLLGVELGSNLMAASDENQKGFWEHLGIVEANERLLEDLGQRWDSTEPLPDGWQDGPEARRCREQLRDIIAAEFQGKALWGFKDPRVARLIPLWRGLLDEIGASARFVIPYRHPGAVADSLRHRDGFTLEKGYLLWLTHILEADAATRGSPTGFVQYEAFFGDWRETMTTLARTLELEWPAPLDGSAAEIESYIDPTLRHSSAPMESELELPHTRWTERVFRALGLADRQSREAELDAVRHMFIEARSVFLPWRDETSLTRDIEHLRREIREGTQYRQELSAGLAKARSDLAMLHTALEDARDSQAELNTALEDARGYVTALEDSRAELRTALEDARGYITALEATEQRLLAANDRLGELATSFAHASTALLTSKRWRFGHAIGNVLSLMRLRPTGCPAADDLMVHLRALERQQRPREENA
jgi:hypothetical protein